MVDRPLVTVVTPTWDRNDFILRAIRSVIEQTWRPIQHVVVSDGPNPELMDSLRAIVGKTSTGYELKVEELPEHRVARWGHYARLRGIELADGDFIAYLDDDDELFPDHIERLAQLLVDDPEVGFSYSKILIHEVSGDLVAGFAPPGFTAVSTSALMNRKEILSLATWRDQPGLNKFETIDWDIAARWIGQGVKWGFCDQVTVQAHRDAPNVSSDRPRTTRG